MAHRIERVDAALREHPVFEQRQDAQAQHPFGNALAFRSGQKLMERVVARRAADGE